jgi:hypothetical protein
MTFWYLELNFNASVWNLIILFENGETCWWNVSWTLWKLWQSIFLNLALFWSLKTKDNNWQISLHTCCPTDASLNISIKTFSWYNTVLWNCIDSQFSKGWNSFTCTNESLSAMYAVKVTEFLFQSMLASNISYWVVSSLSFEDVASC